VKDEITLISAAFFSPSVLSSSPFQWECASFGQDDHGSSVCSDGGLSAFLSPPPESFLFFACVDFASSGEGFNLFGFSPN